jgi:hypothetical protein
MTREESQSAVSPAAPLKIVLDPEVPFEAMARLHAILAYPNDARACEKFAIAIGWWYLRGGAKLCKNDPVLLTVPPLYIIQDQAQMDKAFKAGFKIIDEARMPSAITIGAFFEEWIYGKKISLHPIDKPLTLAACAGWFQDESRRRKLGDNAEFTGEGKNFELRKWRPTKPILHLALAVHLERKDNNGSLLADFNDMSAVKRVVELSQQMQILLPLIGKEYGLSLPELVQIEIEDRRPHIDGIKNN